MIREITSESLVSEVLLERSGHGNPIFLVEGPSDETFYERHLANFNGGFVICFGKTNQDYAVDTLNQINRIKGYVGLRDRDYDFLETMPSRSNQVVTDYCDMTMFTVENDGFVVGLRALVTKRSLDRLKKRLRQSVAEAIYEATLPIAAIRLVATKHGVSVEMDGFEFKYINRSPYNVDVTKLENGLRERLNTNSEKVSEIYLEAREIVAAGQHDAKSICSGHDYFRAAERFLKAHFSAPQVGAVDGPLLERIFVGSYDRSHFSETNMAGELRTWLAENGYNANLIARLWSREHNPTLSPPIKILRWTPKPFGATFPA